MSEMVNVKLPRATAELYAAGKEGVEDYDFRDHSRAYDALIAAARQALQEPSGVVRLEGELVDRFDLLTGHRCLELNGAEITGAIGRQLGPAARVEQHEATGRFPYGWNDFHHGPVAIEITPAKEKGE